MKRYMLAICILMIFCGCATAAPEAAGSHPPDSLIGKWRYVDCTIKNTFVSGTVTFRENGTFFMDATARDDYPVGRIKGTYTYSAENGMFSTNYAKGYGLSEYFLIKGDDLYFAASPIPSDASLIRDEGKPVYWRFRLVRVR